MPLTAEQKRAKANRKRAIERYKNRHGGQRNRNMRGLSTARYNGFKPLGNTNNFYHNTVPRTLQIATRRSKQQTLRFVKNYTIKVTPSHTSAPAQAVNTYISIRANSIVDIIKDYGEASGVGNDFTFQDQTTDFVSTPLQNAEGVEDWKERFSEFVVLGSKLSMTYDSFPGSSMTPATLYCQLTGSAGNIGTSTEMAQINKYPYVVRSRVINGGTVANVGLGSRPGARLASFYSTKKFEGVSDPSDNDQLRGHFTNALATPSQNGVPTEQSFYNIGLCPTFRFSPPVQGVNDGLAPPGVLTIRVEYITKLMEPTLTNQVSAGMDRA